MDQRKTSDDGTRRAAGHLLLGGALLLLIGNMVHPVDATPTALSRFEFATAASWLPIHLAIGVGFLVVAVGLILVAAPAARSGSVAATVLLVASIVGGATMAVVFVALDGHAVSSLADQWEAAGQGAREVIESAAIALEAIDSGAAAFGTLALMGVAMLALAATLRDGAHVRLAGAAVVVGVLGGVTGVALLWSGPTPTTINWLLRPAAAGMTLTLVALGVHLRRDAGRRGAGSRESARPTSSSAPTAVARP